MIGNNACGSHSVAGHQHAVPGFAADRQLMAAAGIEATVPDSGCSGLAGNFGFRPVYLAQVLQLAVRRDGR